AHRSPANDRMRREPPLAQQVVRGFGGAGVGSGKDFGMGEDQTLPAGDGVGAETKPGLEVRWLELGFRRAGRGVITGRGTDIAGVDSVDTEHAMHAIVGGGIAENLAE